MSMQESNPEDKAWPKYYANQLIVNDNPEARVALTTGWTKKEDVWGRLSEESKKRVSVSGQLYSKEGINFIIRNTFLNPDINFLVITGRDLSGSIKEFKSFLSGEKKEFIHEEIPEEKVKEFIDYFSKHHLFAEVAEVDEAIRNIDLSTLPGRWTEEAIDFPDHIAKEAATFPSEKVCFRIEDDKVAKVWLKVLDRILKFGYVKMSAYGEKQRELIDIVTVVNGDDPDDPYIPSYLYFNKDDLLNYYPQMMTDGIFEGVEYTYGSRLRNHDGVNQIEAMIKELEKENFSRRAIAFTWNVEKDCGNSKAPCLDLVQALVQDDVLYLTAYFRSNDMYRAWPQNAYGLLKIQKEIASRTGLRVGKMAIVSCSAHIYERDFLEAENMVSKNKPRLECEMDPRGNFVIEVRGDELYVKHVDAEGIFLQEFKGKNSREIRDQISKFITDPAHALYLGEELFKAEWAMRHKMHYCQDQDLK